MELKELKLFTVVGAVALASAACGKASPAQPSSTNGGSAGTSYTTPGGLTPADKAQISFASQPILLTIANSVASSGQSTSYSVEVATDAGFTQKVFTRSNLPAETGGGVTHQTIDAKLPGSTTYYWHTQVTSGTSVGPFGPTYSFTIGPEILVQPPVPSNPVANGTATGAQAQLTTANAARSGPVTKITYLFQVSDSSSFGNLLFSKSVDEGAGGSGGSTTVAVTANLTAGPTYYWRVQASDASGVTSAFSPAVPFKFLSFDFTQAIIEDSPHDLGFWPQTATITSVYFQPDQFDVDFDRRDGPDRWPDLDFGDGGGGTLEYTLGMCGFVAGAWHCSAVVQFWYGRDLGASTPPSYVAQNWFYAARWGALQGYQPADGEQVGLFVGNGNLRDKGGETLATCPQVCQRSNVQFVTWQNEGSTLYQFALKGLHAIIGK
jgi:hypothetical protein